MRTIESVQTINSFQITDDTGITIKSTKVAFTREADVREHGKKKLSEKMKLLARNYDEKMFDVLSTLSLEEIPLLLMKNHTGEAYRDLRLTTVKVGSGQICLGFTGDGVGPIWLKLDLFVMRTNFRMMFRCATLKLDKIEYYVVEYEGGVLTKITEETDELRRTYEFSLVDPRKGDAKMGLRCIVTESTRREER